MRVTESQLAALVDMLSPFRAQVHAHAEKLKKDTRVQHLPTRLRWDWLYAVPSSIRNPWVDALYGDGSTDEHIDTALRHAVTELGFPEFAEKP